MRDIKLSELEKIAEEVILDQRRVNRGGYVAVTDLMGRVRKLVNPTPQPPPRDAERGGEGAKLEKEDKSSTPGTELE